MAKVVAVKKDEDRKIIGVKLDNGNVFMGDAMYNEASNKGFDNVSLIHNKRVGDYLRSSADDTENNNLDELPEFD